MTIKQALEHAKDIIESYEMDIRNWDKGRLLREGFCQGRMYKRALKRVRELEGEDERNILHSSDCAFFKNEYCDCDAVVKGE